MPEQQDLFAPHGPRIYSVSEVNDGVRRLLDDSFAEVIVEGEVSNARRQSSGHWYFTLKDDVAQLGAVMFRSDAVTLRFDLDNGLRVHAWGRLTLYAPQGKFQMVVRALEPVGQGALELAFRQLKEKLEREGLFAASRKQTLPRVPRRIVILTSPTGAAVRDMLRTLRDRWPLARVYVVPIVVQGDAAPRNIVRALQFVNRTHAADVIILGRGGGSLEDLWAFNDEAVARAIAASRIPVVSGVGHEVDFTIADFVADARAATPTAAATTVVPDRREVMRYLREAQRRSTRALQRRCNEQRQRLELLLRSYGLRRPRLLIDEFQQSLDARVERAQRALVTLLQQRASSLAGLRGRLDALGPRGVLARGYTYCVDEPSGQLVPRADGTQPQQRIRIHFADGTVPAQVTGPARPDAGRAGAKQPSDATSKGEA